MTVTYPPSVFLPTAKGVVKVMFSVVSVCQSVILFTRWVPPYRTLTPSVQGPPLLHLYRALPSHLDMFKLVHYIRPTFFMISAKEFWNLKIVSQRNILSIIWHNFCQSLVDFHLLKSELFGFYLCTRTESPYKTFSQWKHSSCFWVITSKLHKTFWLMRQWRSAEASL